MERRKSAEHKEIMNLPRSQSEITFGITAIMGEHNADRNKGKRQVKKLLGKEDNALWCDGWGALNDKLISFTHWKICHMNIPRTFCRHTVCIVYPLNKKKDLVSSRLVFVLMNSHQASHNKIYFQHKFITPANMMTKIFIFSLFSLYLIPFVSPFRIQYGRLKKTKQSYF